MLYKLTVLVLSLLLIGFVQAQNSKLTRTNEDKVITGEETPDLNGIEVANEKTTATTFQSVVAGGLTFDVHNITNRATGYDLQSNASTQQVWVDPNNHLNVHAIFTNSQETAGWADRTCLYYGSDDGGLNWLELGPMPTTTRSGFPAIYGDANGSGVATNHNAFFGTTKTSVMIDNSPFEYNFTNHDPGTIVGGDPIWPRHTVADNGAVIFASSQNGPDSFFVNVLDPSIPSFLGYLGIDGEQAEQYAFARSEGGKIGLAYNGQDAPADNSGDVFYIESDDNGLTWTDALKIYERDHTSDTTYGAIRGVTVSFYGEEPCVAYEICQQIFSAGNFFPGLPSEIHFWSPGVNGGVPMVVADSSSAPYNPHVGTNDVMVPICRPVLGRSQTNNLLFLAFSVTTADVFPSPDTTSYMAGYFMWSEDGGNTWTPAEKFTPDSPLLDWRYISIADIAPSDPLDDDLITIHMVVQGDSIPGSTVNTAGMPVGVTAQYYHFSAEVTVVSADEDPILVNEFNLEQNYPNPFNPSTSIKYTLAETSDVNLKVYDVLGNEVVTLVNSTQNAGSHTISFDASNLASGLYIYTLNTGNFTSSKKMMLLK